MKKFFSFLVLLAIATAGYAQVVSTNGGSIQGVITDETGAAVPNVSIVVTNPDTGSSHTLASNSAGYYSLGPLVPGNYVISLSAPKFQHLVVTTVVRTGTVTSGNERLKVGSNSETVEVQAGAVQVNTEQISLSNVITKAQIDSLPVNGRNFLDLAQIEPGVVLEEGEFFDPTKAGYSALSVGGTSGRTTRILLDGQDITDETVGTTIFNVSQGAIGEFQLNRSTQDVSGEVTSQGLVLISTNSGTNALHGQLFYNFQDNRAGFASAQYQLNPPFQRNQFGGSVGGPILKDKLFFFGNVERIKQDQFAASPVTQGGIFEAIRAAHPTIPSPFRDTYSTIRLDYDGPFGGHYFVRGNYEVNGATSNGGYGYSLYSNRDNTPGIVGGADFQRGRFTHSVRYGYEKFHNMIVDQTSGNTSIYNGFPGFAFYNLSQDLYSGPNYIAPQSTYQSDKQLRYDGSWTKGAQTVRFGYALNRILGGGFASIFGYAPRVNESTASLLATCNDDGVSAPCPSDPLRGYHIRGLYLGNGLGFSTETPGFGASGGGTGDWRQSAYVSDTWKALPDLTVIAGLRWSVDTGRANQDLQTPRCSDVDTTQVAAPCNGSGSLFAQWNPALGASHVHQPYANFAPQLGLNYSPGDHKTSFRSSIGIYYENDIFNNTTNARSSLLKSGAFNQYPAMCDLWGSYSFHTGDGSLVTAAPNGTSIRDLCDNMSIATAAPQIIAMQAAYQANSAANRNVPNVNYVGNTLTPNGVYGTPYRTPYSIQFGGGVQREIFKGAVLSVDYVHNATLKIGQYIDQNHIGAARTLNTAAANAAIARTVNPRASSAYNGGYYGFPACAGLVGSAAIDCAIGQGATIDDFAYEGLDSGKQYTGGQPVSYYFGNTALTPNANGAAFAGQNGLLGNGNFILPIGKTAYDALQIVFRSQQSHPLPGVVSSNLQVSYSLSRVISTGSASSPDGSSDAFFSGANAAADNDHPVEFMGRANLDHTHALSFGGSGTLKYGPRISVIGHVFSAPPSSLTLDDGDPIGDIFRTDVTGDGTTGDYAPGTLPGYYGHQIKAKDLRNYITNFNATQAGRLTPAGQALVSAGIATQAQLRALGATIQPIALPASSSFFQFPRFASMDASFSYPIPVGRFFGRDGFSLEPGIVFYNALNIANYGGVTALGVLLNTSTVGDTTVSPYQTGYLTGNNTSTLNNGRTQRGSGTFDQGASRSTEFQLKLNF